MNTIVLQHEFDKMVRTSIQYNETIANVLYKLKGEFPFYTTSALWKIVKNHPALQDELLAIKQFKFEDSEGEDGSSYSVAKREIHPDFTFSAEFEMVMKNDTVRKQLRDALDKIKVKTGVDDHREGLAECWTFQSDGSIRVSDKMTASMELSTPILKGRHGVRELYKVMRIFDKFQNDGLIGINQSCGTHIRIGNWINNIDEANAVCAFAINQESLLGQFLSKSRRKSGGHQYCRWNENYREKYTAYSSRPFREKQNCIEIRAHQGTLNFDKIMHWILLNQKLVVFALKLHQDKETYRKRDMNHFFKKLEVCTELQAFLLKRISELTESNVE